VLRLLVRLGRCWSQQMTYIQWVHAEPLQLVRKRPAIHVCDIIVADDMFAL
jgi:hypothetical protein